MSKTAFHTLCNCTSLETKLRKAIPVENRLAIFLDWAGSGSSLQHLAQTYVVSKSAVVRIVHEAVEVLCKDFEQNQIRVPEGAELLRVMDESKGLCNLSLCWCH
jgi:hypothetical protein